MWDNIGKKLKGVAKAMCILAAIGGVIASYLVWYNCYFEEEILIGFLIIALSLFVALVSSWFIYGFGELVEKVSDIERNTRGGERKSEATESERKVEAKELYDLDVFANVNCPKCSEKFSFRVGTNEISCPHCHYHWNAKLINK